MLRKQFQRSLLLHVIIYLSPKCLKRVKKVTEENRLFQKTRIQTILDKSPPGQYCNIHIFLLFLGSFPLKTVQRFRNCVAVLLPPTLYKVETRKKNSGYTRPTCDFLQKNIALVQQVSFQFACKISQCCIQARYHGCKALTVFDFVCFDLFFVLFCFFFVWLFVCFFLFSVYVKVLIAVNSLGVIQFPYFVVCLLLR